MNRASNYSLAVVSPFAALNLSSDPGLLGYDAEGYAYAVACARPLRHRATSAVFYACARSPHYVMDRHTWTSDGVGDGASVGSLLPLLPHLYVGEDGPPFCLQRGPSRTPLESLWRG
jgi:hypothetical protein